MMTTEIFTIGHSNHTWESFAPLLADNGIELLVDTRTRPVSRFAPFANHRTLPDLLEGSGIDYEFMGGPLGGKPQNPAMYNSGGKPDYHKMRALDDFQEAISQLAGMASRRATAYLTNYARDAPTTCCPRPVSRPRRPACDDGLRCHASSKCARCRGRGRSRPRRRQ